MIFCVYNVLRVFVIASVLDSMKEFHFMICEFLDMVFRLLKFCICLLIVMVTLDQLIVDACTIF